VIIRKTLIWLADVASACSIAVAAFLSLAMISFGSPSRPWWSSDALYVVMLIGPLGLSIVLLLGAANRNSDSSAAKACGLLTGALVSPIARFAIGIGMPAIRLLA
jgi:hypothetical protein